VGVRSRFSNQRTWVRIQSCNNSALITPFREAARGVQGSPAEDLRETPHVVTSRLFWVDKLTGDAAMETCRFERAHYPFIAKFLQRSCVPIARGIILQFF
jgi:hypothetical protein